ncbi:MAG: V-type ATP synthase subunit A [Deltaproteobacteria bacterium]|nr:V-type ATP synthase subunit A [Deltaproteobacteria bacterium]
MTGRIDGISGPTVNVKMPGLRLYDRVYVGHAMLTGEVVRLAKQGAVIQVYENTAGLAMGEPVRGAGLPLAVRLGPGLLSGIFDGLQRPLQRLKEEIGPFITGGQEISALDYTRKFHFFPQKNKGEEVKQGDILGYFAEGAFKHHLVSRWNGTLAWLVSGACRLDSPIGRFEDGTEIPGSLEWPVRVPRPYRRKLTVSDPLLTGQRCVDFLFPMARGGTVILPGGFGTGKTILEQSIAKFADVDIVVYVGCGERGNEMAELIDEFGGLNDPWTGRKLMERTIFVANTSNMPVAAREASIYTAVSMAEYYRDMGLNVLLLADSLSRWAEALREISSSLEEMPGEEGYPTYLASRLSSFFERAGTVETLSGATGSLSMILSVSPPGGDFTEPVTQACMRATGGFLMLDTTLAHRRHFPAINWLQSYSLYEKSAMAYFNGSLSPAWEEAIRRCRDILSREMSLTAVAEIVGHDGLQDADRLLMRTAETIRQEFLCQNAYTEDAFSPPEKTLAAIAAILQGHDSAAEKITKGGTLDEIVP